MVKVIFQGGNFLINFEITAVGYWVQLDANV